MNKLIGKVNKKVIKLLDLEYKKDNNYVLVAVRITKKGRMFARTLFTMTKRKKNIYLEKRICQKIPINTCKNKKCMLL